MPDLKSKIESLLFISNKPFAPAKLAELTGAKKGEVEEAIGALEKEYGEREGGGIFVLRQGDKVQMATNPGNADAVREFLKDETTGEMTRPALETLAIVAYRGPVAKAEIEQIRGINCSLILRNLLIKGLVESKPGRDKELPLYDISFDFLRCLGIKSVKELPDYERLSGAEELGKLLGEQEAENSGTESKGGEDGGQPDFSEEGDSAEKPGAAEGE